MPEVTAVFVANDQMALGVLRALREHGRRVPEDISVVGFDDIPESAYFAPPLTTVRQWMQEDEALGVYRFAIEDLYRQQEHVLDDEGERLCVSGRRD